MNEKAQSSCTGFFNRGGEEFDIKMIVPNEDRRTPLWHLDRVLVDGMQTMTKEVPHFLPCPSCKKDEKKKGGDFQHRARIVWVRGTLAWGIWLTICWNGREFACPLEDVQEDIKFPSDVEAKIIRLREAA